MIVTARYQNPLLRGGGYLAVPISLGLPRWALAYELEERLMDLAPRYSYLRAPFEEYAQRYRAQLSRVGVKRIEVQLQARMRDGRPVALLCFEDLRDPALWCHRRLFAAWWLEQTGEVVEELAEEAQLGMF